MNSYNKIIYTSLENYINDKNIISIIISFIRKEFNDEEELKNAVDKWINNDSKDKKELINIYGPIEYWDVSNVTDMSKMFYMCHNFNEDVSKWDVSNVTDMSEMFYMCHKFNQDISGWDVSNVTIIDSMFEECINFNQVLDKWNVRIDNLFEISIFEGCNNLKKVPIWYEVYYSNIEKIYDSENDHQPQEDDDDYDDYIKGMPGLGRSIK